MSEIDYLPMPAAGLRPSQAAQRLGASRQSLHVVLSRRAGISADMAALIGNSPRHWHNMHALYDLQRSRERHGDEIEQIEWVAA